MIAAAACTDATAPEATPPVNAFLKSDIKKPRASTSGAAPASIWSGYSPQTHHWSHITPMMTDFYYSWTPTERAWAGAHYDYAMSGSGSAWRAVNPTVGHLTYALLWTMLIGGSTSLATGYYADMTSWFAAHPQYPLEKAFVHKAGAPFNASGRDYYQWGSTRLPINPKDPGAIAYTINRVQRIAAADGGVFFDESASGDMNAHLGTMQEFPSRSAYVAAVGNLLGALKSSVGSKMLMINTAEYMTPQDSINVVRAGAAHLELFNSFTYSGMVSRWQWIEHLAHAGTLVDVVSAHSSQDIPSMTSYPRGNSATNVQRAKLWELSSYYMAVPTATGGRFPAIQLENKWSKPYSSIWTKAQEANIGHPKGLRKQIGSGTDPLGNRYLVYTRDFDRALVVIRLQQGWGSQTYTDGTATTVPLPSGERWIPLNADGTVGSPVTSIRLRNSEAAILLKGSTL